MKTLTHGIVLHTLPALLIVAFAGAVGQLAWLPLLLTIWAVGAMWEASIGQVRAGRARAARTRAALRSAGLYVEPASPPPSSRPARRQALAQCVAVMWAATKRTLDRTRRAFVVAAQTAEGFAWNLSGLLPIATIAPAEQTDGRHGSDQIAPPHPTHVARHSGEFPIIGRPVGSLRLSTTWRATAGEIAAAPVTRFFTDERMGSFADRELVGAR